MEDTARVWLLQVIAMMITALLIPRLRITSLLGAAGIVMALAAFNATLWDSALFSAIPQAATVEALVLLIVNGVIFFVLTKVIPGIEVRGVLPALVAPLVFTIVGGLVTRYASDVDLSDLAVNAMDGVVRLREWLGGSEAASGSAAKP